MTSEGAPESQVVSTPPERMSAPVVVIGSGPGGAVTACLLAEAGRDVLVVEEGTYHRLGSCPPFSRAEMVQKYRSGGVTIATGRCKVSYVEGACIGGGSEINSGLYHRTPTEVLEAWQERLQIREFRPEDLEPHFAACEQDLSVSYLPYAAPPASLKLHDGATQLGWSSLEVPRWYSYASGQEARQSMTETYVPRARAAGARFVPNTRVMRLRRIGAKWHLDAQHRTLAGETRSVQITAETVFVSGGAIQTPALLRRSGMRAGVGNSLRMHPTVKVVAVFPETVNSAGMGVPVHQVKEFSPRFSLGCSISARAHLALAMLDHPSHALEVDDHWQRMAIYYAMTTGGSGSVRALAGFRDPWVRYQLSDTDLGELADALVALCRCLLAAGAECLFPSVVGLPPIRSEADLALIPRPLPRNRTNLMTIHLMGSCPMGENRALAAADSFGKLHGENGLYLADASLLGGAASVNPQGSVMAIVRRNALHFLER